MGILNIQPSITHIPYKTNAIAFSTRRIPYMPELRTYCKTITSSLLMTQLEYRFAGMPNGYYKFLSPCAHPLYKNGDSWTEELAFSEAEIRTAFENIGVRYRSKTLLTECINQGSDPFQGKPYLSYVDVKNGLTYYIRNHEVAGAVIDSVLNNFKPVMEQADPDDISPCELNIPDLRNLTILSSKARDSSFPYKEALEDIQEKTAEAEGCKSERAEQASSPVIEKTASSADFVLSDSDLLIGDALSLPQVYRLKNMVKKIHLAGALQAYPADKLFELLSHTILSPKSYPKAGQDFILKLNIIHKSIQNGTWTPPADFVLKKQVEAEKARLASIKAEEARHKRQQDAFDEYCAEHFISFLNETPPELVRAWMELWRGQVKDPFTLKLIKQAEVEGFKHPAVRGLFKAFLLTYLPDVYAMPSGAFKEIRQSSECVT